MTVRVSIIIDARRGQSRSGVHGQSCLAPMGSSTRGLSFDLPLLGHGTTAPDRAGRPRALPESPELRVVLRQVR
jgi:hypothetical protein